MVKVKKGDQKDARERFWRLSTQLIFKLDDEVYHFVHFVSYLTLWLVFTQALVIIYK